MSPNSGAIVYACECGKKWVVDKSKLKNDTQWDCKCGRKIVTYRGAIFSTRQ